MSSNSTTDRIQELRAIGVELMQEVAQWIEGGTHSGSTDPRDSELLERAASIIGVAIETTDERSSSVIYRLTNQPEGKS